MDINQALQTVLDKVTGWLEALVAMIPEIILAIFLLVACAWVARGVQNLVRRVMNRVTDHGPVRTLVARAAFIAIWAGGIFLALAILNLDKTVTSLLAGLGIVGLALGFAFQDIAQNFISGILLTIRRPFTDGDLIETEGYLGTVEQVDLRATIIRTLQGQIVRIPNGAVYGGALVNYTEAGIRRMDVSCGVTYDADLEKVKRVALEALNEIDGGDPGRDPELFFEEFGGSSINFVGRVWLAATDQKTWLRARSDAMMRLKRAFDENDIGIPFPIMTLDFGDSGTRTLDAPLEVLKGSG